MASFMIFFFGGGGVYDVPTALLPHVHHTWVTHGQCAMHYGFDMKKNNTYMGLHTSTSGAPKESRGSWE